jgi:hypothetical protein
MEYFKGILSAGKVTTVQTPYFVSVKMVDITNQDPAIGKADRYRKTFANRNVIEGTSAKFPESRLNTGKNFDQRYAPLTPRYSS